MQEHFKEAIKQEEKEIQREAAQVRQHEKHRVRGEIQASHPEEASQEEGSKQRVPGLRKNLFRLGGLGILLLAAYGILSLTPIHLGFQGKERENPGATPALSTREKETAPLQNKISNASLLLTQGDFEGAITLFEEVRSADPQFAAQYDAPFAEAFFLRGNENKDSSPDSALDDFQRACQMNPKHFEAHFEMGRLLTTMKKYREAILSYQKAIENNPDFPDAHFNLGYLYFRKKAYVLAAEEFESVVKLKPPYLKDAYFNLGLSYLRMGEKKKALKAFQNTLRLDPKDKRVIDLVKRLKRS